LSTNTNHDIEFPKVIQRWDELYPLEQTRVIQLLVEQVTVSTDGMRVRIRSNGLHSLVSELKSVQDRTESEECLV